MRTVLNVAEKPSVASAIAKHLGGNKASYTPGLSKYNPVYEFPYTIQGHSVNMKVTSVTGHVMGLDFPSEYSKWQGFSPALLFRAPIQKKVPADKQSVAANLRKSAQGTNCLILWLDCDREGENIAYEVIEIVQQEISLAPDSILRAHFSALTYTDLTDAVQNLTRPNPHLSESVDARQELDLRLGAAFTRLQTLELRKHFAGVKVLSWGPCQLPTLGFVVKRQLEIEKFEPEQYWTVDMKLQRAQGVLAKFAWGRDRLFSYLASVVLYESCVEAGEAVVKAVQRAERTKFRPLPLATVSFQKLVSSKLRISSHECMEIAEKLYNQGYISYPRTETDSFKTTINLQELVNMHRTSQH